MKLQKLHHWLTAEKLSAAKWGRGVGIYDRSTAARYVNGERMAPPAVVIRTYLWSGGQVRPDDWYELPALDEAEERAA